MVVAHDASNVKQACSLRTTHPQEELKLKCCSGNQIRRRNPRRVQCKRDKRFLPSQQNRVEMEPVWLSCIVCLFLNSSEGRNQDWVQGGSTLTERIATRTSKMKKCALSEICIGSMDPRPGKANLESVNRSAKQTLCAKSGVDLQNSEFETCCGCLCHWLRLLHFASIRKRISLLDWFLQKEQAFISMTPGSRYNMLPLPLRRSILRDKEGYGSLIFMDFSSLCLGWRKELEGEAKLRWWRLAT